LVGEDGKRFAKRDQSLTLKSLRESGHSLEDVKTLMAKFGGHLDEVPF
jgi:glutamyl-Q tRNA(Asp) synthetase